jgi:hypothetical protein
LDRTKLHFHDGIGLSLAFRGIPSSGLPISAGVLELALILWLVPLAVGDSYMGGNGRLPDRMVYSGSDMKSRPFWEASCSEPKKQAAIKMVLVLTTLEASNATRKAFL